MMRCLRSRVRRLLYDLRTEGSGPHREAAAVGVGIFTGCLPLYGLHLPICLAAATLFRLNRLKTYLAANISNPFVAPWLLLAEVQAGAFIRRGAFHELTLGTLQSTGLRIFAGDLAVGSVAVGGVLAGLGAWGTYLLIRRDRHDDPFLDLVRRAAERYAETSLTAWEFARAKMRFDPVYRALLCDGLLEPGGRTSATRTLVDVGCGQGLTLALLSEARADDRWRGGAALTTFDRLIGIEKRRRVAAIASAALGREADVVAADVRELALERADVFLFLDVLHMISREEQDAVLTSVGRSLSGDGRILIREANPGGGWRFAMVTTGNRLKALAGGTWRPRFAFRTIAEWEACFSRLGLHCQARDMGHGTPFANVLFVVTRAETATPSTGRTDTSTAGVL
jgi:uncharacterized protein (DUF2062 family)